MEPVTWMIVILALLLAGTGKKVVASRQKARRKRLGLGLLTKMPLPWGPVSAFDIFWDLGANDWALLMMAHTDLLPQSPDDFPQIATTIEGRIAAHGSYQEFIHDLLESIDEVFAGVSPMATRRQLPHLISSPKRLLPLHPPAQNPHPVAHVHTPGALLTQNPEKEADFPHDPSIPLDFQARFDARTIPSQTAAPRTIDLDDMLRAKPLDLLQSLFQGGISSQVKRWVELRGLRVLRDELDRELEALYQDFDLTLAQHPALFEGLYDQTKRWSTENLRLKDLLAQAPWRGRPHAEASALLTQEAEALSRYLARQCRQNADEAIDALRQCVDRRQFSEAGYLIYQNRFALFAGRSAPHLERFNRIETLTAHIQAELRTQSRHAPTPF